MARPERDEGDAFGFGAIGKDTEIDLSAFAPKPKAIDNVAADAAAEVAEVAGFTRRAPAKSERRPRGKSAPAPEKGAKGRVNINDLLGIQDRYPATQRAQLNLLAPVPVVLRWRELVAASNGRPAWEILERAMEALEASSSPASAGGRS
jgi:hypothetical protein